MSSDMSILDGLGGVVVPGLLIVFLALVILIAAVFVMGRVFSTSKGGGTAPKAKASPPPAAAAPAKAAPVSGGISGETVAAITAAVACVMEETAPGIPYAITGVTRASSGRPVWGFAGMQQNTRPF